MGEKNILKANQIIRYFGENPGQNPLNLTLSNLFSFFSKVFMCHFLQDKSDAGVGAALGIRPFFAKEYILASKKYNPTKLYEIIGILRDYDMKSKGYGVSTIVDTAELQKEIIYKILH